MITAPHFHAGDRVRTLRPINLMETNRSGTILRWFFGADLYDVLFDGQAEPRIVIAENLIEETPVLAREYSAA
jgi:hypothetical protein